MSTCTAAIMGATFTCPMLLWTYCTSAYLPVSHNCFMGIYSVYPFVFLVSLQSFDFGFMSVCFQCADLGLLLKRIILATASDSVCKNNAILCSQIHGTINHEGHSI